MKETAAFTLTLYEFSLLLTFCAYGNHPRLFSTQCEGTKGRKQEFELAMYTLRGAKPVDAHIAQSVER